MLRHGGGGARRPLPGALLWAHTGPEGGSGFRLPAVSAGQQGTVTKPTVRLLVCLSTRHAPAWNSEGAHLYFSSQACGTCLPVGPSVTPVTKGA